MKTPLKKQNNRAPVRSVGKTYYRRTALRKQDKHDFLTMSMYMYYKNFVKVAYSGQGPCHRLAEQEARRLAGLPDFDATPDYFLSPAGYARRNIHGEARQDLLNGMESAVLAVSDGKSVDAAKILQESTALGRIYQQALFNPLLAQNPFNPQVRLTYSRLAAELDISLGDIFVDVGDAAINARGQIEARSNFGMVKFIWTHGETASTRSSKRVTKQDILTFPEILRTVVPSINEQGGYRWIVQAEDGRKVQYVAKNFTETDGKSHLVTVHVLNNSQVQKLGGTSKKITDAVSSDRGFAPRPEIPQGELSNTGQSGPAEAVSRSPMGQASVVEASASGKNINSASMKVNSFAVEAPETFMPAPERTQEQRTVLEEIGYSEKSGMTVEEQEAMSFIEAGVAPREEGLSLMEAQDAETMRKNIEDAGYSIMGCVMEVIE